MTTRIRHLGEELDRDELACRMIQAAAAHEGFETFRPEGLTPTEAIETLFPKDRDKWRAIADAAMAYFAEGPRQ